MVIVAAVTALDLVTGPDLSVLAGYLVAVLLVTCAAPQPVPFLVAGLCVAASMVVALGQEGSGTLGTQIGSGASRLVVLLAASHIGSLLLITVDSLEMAATTDPLTGLLNRRGLALALDAAVAQAARRDVPLAVVAFDLDGLKRVNDQRGHQAGDAMISSFSEHLLRVRRAGDHIARVGGDEFVVVLPDVDEDGAAAMVRRLAASGGCPAFGHGTAVKRDADQSGADVLQRADLALVDAKQLRRSQDQSGSARG